MKGKSCSISEDGRFFFKLKTPQAPKNWGLVESHTELAIRRLKWHHMWGGNPSTYAQALGAAFGTTKIDDTSRIKFMDDDGRLSAARLGLT